MELVENWHSDRLRIDTWYMEEYILELLEHPNLSGGWVSSDTWYIEEYIMELFEHWHSVGVGGVKPSASGVDTLKKVFLIYCYNCYLAE